MTKSAPRATSTSSEEFRRAIGIGETVAALLNRLDANDIVFIARDEHEAGAIARAMEAGGGSHCVLYCPGSDALPGDKAPSTPANAGQRTSALRKLRSTLGERREHHIALVTTGESCARLYPPPQSFEAAPPILRCGDRLDFSDLADTLEDLGYFADERVDEPGEYALRGLVADIYPVDFMEPCRIEVADGYIVSIRGYDPISQRSLATFDRIEIGRANEPETGEGVTLLAHLPGAEVVIGEGADKRRRALLDLAADAAERQSAAVSQTYCENAVWEQSLSDHVVTEPVGCFAEPPPRFAEKRDPMRAFVRAAKDALVDGKVLLLGTARDLRFIAPRAARKLVVEIMRVASWAEAASLPPGTLAMLAMPLPRGFRHLDMLVICASDLLGSRAQRSEDEPFHAELDLFQLGELRKGDVVIHEDHGLCVIDGLEPSPDGTDAIVLRFAADTRRLIPAFAANRIWRYGADETAVTLDKLDGSSWQKRRAQIEAAIAETATELARLAAERKERVAPILEPDPAEYERFADGFPFSETPDQARAIAAVRQDMASGSPMDRLVIGDVGYGKTEVALRGAAVAALAGKQVALAVPTTVLARQHLATFTQRFKGLGIKVAGLSRLSSAAEKKAVKQGLADGSIAVVIGTGALAAKDVTFADLGLVIVDEEQRFGAGDKARLAGLGAHHLLTLSATPIPRTLQTALVGLQQLSIIATAPSRRQPIRSSVGVFDETSVRSALLRERGRGGQSFVVVPRIADLDGHAATLERLVPELRVLIAHGKLPVGELDETMVRFAQGEGDVLLATNIIEAGLDVPRANTMIVCRADRFGLSQLHQLRGRVGRGSRRGRILLLTEADLEIAPRTLARLNTLAAFDRLGAGFAISARDLDMRGAGDLLGEEQAGHTKLIGVELYQYLLEQAISRARGDVVDVWTPEINAGLIGALPGDWIPDADLRITLYARLSRIMDLSRLERFEEELVDRFGELPEPAADMLAASRLRVLARLGGIERVDAGPAAIALTPRHGYEKAMSKLSLERSRDRHLCKGDFTDAGTRLAKAEELMAEIA